MSRSHPSGDSSRAAAAGWPPPPHDPRERAVLATVGSWEIRHHPPADPKHAYFAPRGFLHLQLWHPAAQVSILTPSRLTLGHYEIFPIRGWKHREVSLVDVDRVLRYLLDLPLPGLARIRALERWFVERPERESRRAEVTRRHREVLP